MLLLVDGFKEGVLFFVLIVDWCVVDWLENFVMCFVVDGIYRNWGIGWMECCCINCRDWCVQLICEGCQVVDIVEFFLVGCYVKCGVMFGMFDVFIVFLGCEMYVRDFDVVLIIQSGFCVQFGRCVLWYELNRFYCCFIVCDDFWCCNVFCWFFDYFCGLFVCFCGVCQYIVQ